MAQSTKDLSLRSVIGFDGKVKNSMHIVEPNGDGVKYLVHPLGSTVVIKDCEAGTQSFLRGHTGDIKCLAVSKNGRYAASGETRISGLATIILWDLQKGIENRAYGSGISDGEIIAKMELHKLEVVALDFSHDSEFLVSIGGQDDNTVIIWSTKDGEAMCGEPISSYSTGCVKWYNNSAEGEGQYRCVTAGLNGIMKIWSFDSYRQLFCDKGIIVPCGRIKRNYTCIAITPDDQCMAVGCTSGEVAVVKLVEIPSRDIQPSGGVETEPAPCFRHLLISKDNKRTRYNVNHCQFPKGVCSLTCVDTPQYFPGQQGDYVLLVGGGAGKFAMVGFSDNQGANRFCTSSRVTSKGLISDIMGSINSISCDGASSWLGTSEGNVYSIDLDNIEADPKKPAFSPALKGTSHYGVVNKICFPRDCSSLFITASSESIRVWNADYAQELLRIQVPNQVCNTVDITPTGRHIVSGWDDGKIRAFYPESGRLAWVIDEAHTESVSCIGVVNEDDEEGAQWRTVSGGSDGRVRVWGIGESQRMLCSLKEHRGPVRTIKVTNDNMMCVSASEDGFCLVWSLEKFNRLLAFHANTNFYDVVYHPDESQILTCGSDRKITYWDAADGNAIRVLEGSDPGPNGGGVNSLDIIGEGEHFASGGDDKLVKVFDYDEGVCIAKGTGHSGFVTNVKIAPNREFVVSVGTEGAIMIWDMP